jgi:type II pantothenate kinase
MDLILGIDIGTSSTKLAALRPDGTVVFTRRVHTDGQRLCDDLDSYLSDNGLTLADVGQVLLTGVGASYVEGDVCGLPTRPVDEFAASSAGALALSGQDQGVVATMGTGTAFLWAEKGKTPRHLCGSGVGGGTLTGLCRALAGTGSFEQLQTLALDGDLGRVDLMIRDITKDPAPTLDPTLTAANFGKLTEDASPADLAAGAVNLVLQVIGTMTVLACQCCGGRTVVLTGSVTELAQAKHNFEQFEEIYGIHYIIPENAAFATAIGAALCGLDAG